MAASLVAALMSAEETVAARRTVVRMVGSPEHRSFQADCPVPRCSAAGSQASRPVLASERESGSVLASELEPGPVLASELALASVLEPGRVLAECLFGQT
jgi:hypothetical protein